MAVRMIFKDDNEILFKRCREVTKFNEKLGQLLDDMRETLSKADGIGLAAPQVGLLKRLAIIDYEDLYLEMINPKIIESKGEQIDYEACLSVDSKRTCKVLRPMKVTLEAYDRHGNKYKKELQGMAARACCHELDHLEGVLFYEREHKEGKNKK